MAAGTALVGDFTGSVRLFERQNVTVAWSEATSGGVDLFRTNQRVARVEARMGCAVARGSASCTVTGL